MKRVTQCGMVCALLMGAGHSQQPAQAQTGSANTDTTRRIERLEDDSRRLGEFSSSIRELTNTQAKLLEQLTLANGKQDEKLGTLNEGLTEIKATAAAAKEAADETRSDQVRNISLLGLILGGMQLASMWWQSRQTRQLRDDQGVHPDIERRFNEVALTMDQILKNQSEELPPRRTRR